MFFLVKAWKEKGMKYNKPTIITLSSQVSMWCSVGSNGERSDNGCINGNAPATTQCKIGGSNATGHCISESTVKNQGAATFCMAGSSATGKACAAGTGGVYPDYNCSPGNQAYGGMYGAAACHVGTQACHCYTGANA